MGLDLVIQRRRGECIRVFIHSNTQCICELLDELLAYSPGTIWGKVCIWHLTLSLLHSAVASPGHSDRCLPTEQRLFSYIVFRSILSTKSILIFNFQQSRKLQVNFFFPCLLMWWLYWLWIHLWWRSLATFLQSPVLIIGVFFSIYLVIFCQIIIISKSYY